MASVSSWVVVWACTAVLALNSPPASGWGVMKGEPTVSSDWPSSQVIREGEVLKLTCPINANPEPFYDWFKDGEEIKATWNRYVPRKRSLKIKNIKSADAGRYTCVGVNGFGRVNASITIIVIGKGEVIENLTKPVLTEVWPQEPQQRRLGESLTLTCRTRGFPKPVVTWIKDGVMLSERGEQLTLRSLTQSDSGKYTCKATSDFGRTTANFTLYVGENSMVDQQLKISEAVNTTVVEGGTTSLQCSVRTSQQPRVEWLKEITPGDNTGEVLPPSPRLSNSTRQLGGSLYQMVEGAEGVVSRGNQEYLSKLTLSHASPSEAGVYVCLAVNNLGYSFKRAHLTVLRKPGRDLLPPVSEKETSISWLFLIIPAVVVVVVVIAVIVCQLRRSTPDKPVCVTAPPPVMKGDDPSALTPLNQHDTHAAHPPTLPRPPDLVYQEVSGYSVGGGSIRGGGGGGTGGGTGGTGGHYEYTSPYPESYLDPAYSDPYPGDRDRYPTERVPTRSSDHGYARLPHPSLASHASSHASSTSPQLPPPYVHPHAHAHTHTHTHRHPQYFVHYNL